MDPSDIVFLVFAFVSSILVLIPLPWHLQSWNVGTCLLVIYIAMGCLIRAVDRIVWANNVNYVIPVWCDITTRVIVGLSVGIPAAALCLTRRIYIILGDPWSCSKPGGKRKALVTDLCIGLGCPILSVVFYYIVQGHRYNIFRDYGCTPAAANTLASYFLLWMWPPIIGLVTFVYSGLMIRLFIIRRKQTEESINSNPVLTMHRYIRFVALGFAQAILTLPPSIWVIVENVRCECLIPWVSWSNIKWGFSAVWRFDEVIEVV
ncbi:fungal pheromone STE3G-protein-coupled receptor [Sistotremastrum niveocremeum HHB9708]|uniref:Fungal pheromone STE3G-protein-coupled receptor n=1 Tax=Sistotremastrum niveocremeum HHB9708 TaxID=1314777 RepID=A0A164V4A6_9AGAM|nr:fungal pheromone STE3G-protein-coupled receptor [Sistotremastrum niveocremeum HHB9708]